MKTILIIALVIKISLFLLYLNSRNKDASQKDTNETDKEIDYDTLTNKFVNISELEKCKSEYPFSNWRLNAIEYDMEQYTQENCEAIEMIFEELIADLKTLPNDASAEDKVILFKYAVLATNTMNNRIDGLIETGEREDLCELMDQISIAAGLSPDEFADGEGIASEWREW